MPSNWSITTIIVGATLPPKAPILLPPVGPNNIVGLESSVTTISTIGQQHCLMGLCDEYEPRSETASNSCCGTATEAKDLSGKIPSTWVCFDGFANMASNCSHWCVYLIWVQWRFLDLGLSWDFPPSYWVVSISSFLSGLLFITKSLKFSLNV